MPPRLPTAQVRKAYECPTCFCRRSFTASASLSIVKPESPKYIEVPQPPQQDAPDRPRIKGFLPVPREIFPRRTDLDPYFEKRIQKGALEPDPSKLRNDDSRIAWRQRMAEMRRKNLTEGLEALKDRKQQSDTSKRAFAAEKQRDRMAALTAPEREDERLTSITQDKNLLKALAKGPLPDLNRADRIRASQTKVKEQEKARKTERRDNLHNLYVQARSFITTEAQLSEAIDEAFGTPDKPVRFDQGLSPWHYGRPPSIQELLERASGVGSGSSGAIGSGSNYGSIVQARVKRIAEELTGGKIPDRPDLGDASDPIREFR